MALQLRTTCSEIPDSVLIVSEITNSFFFEFSVIPSNLCKMKLPLFFSFKLNSRTRFNLPINLEFAAISLEIACSYFSGDSYSL